MADVTPLHSPLTFELSESLLLMERYGSEWAAEVARLRRLHLDRHPGSVAPRVVHPSELPSEDALMVTRGNRG